MTDRIWGWYLILRVVNQTRHGESTNIGCALYQDGKIVGAKADTLDRAVARGDLSADRADDLNDYARNYLMSHPTVESVRQAYASTAHAMSSIQLGSLLATAIEPNTLDQIFDRYVLGKRTP